MTATINPTISLLKTADQNKPSSTLMGNGDRHPMAKLVPRLARLQKQKIADIPEASEQDVEDAIAAARRAFDQGAWTKMTGHERQKILTRTAELIEQ